MNEFLAQEASMPAGIGKVIRKILKANEAEAVGFRKDNLPALLAKYFSDMRKVLVEIRQTVRRGGDVFLVVGDNHTKRKGRKIPIVTSHLLSEMMDSLGYQVVDVINMDMLVNREIHRENGLASERIIWARNL